MICKYKIGDMEVHRFTLEPIKSNMYVMINDKKALVIDPCINEEARVLLENQRVEEVTIILTHEHYDHISGVNWFRNLWSCYVIGNENTKNMVVDPTKNLAAFLIALFVHSDKDELELVKKIMDTEYSCTADYGFVDKGEIEFGSHEIRLVNTPGHSPGSICIIVNEDIFFTGDSLIQGVKIITRLPGGNKDNYLQITKPFLDSIPKGKTIFPGHGEEFKL